jgi:TPR repeat protein
MSRALGVVFVVAGCISSTSRTAPEPGSCATGSECEAACEARHDLDACAHASELFFDGKNGHPLDHARSFRNAKRACDKDHPLGCSLLGLHYQDGLGVAWNPARAVEVYEQACRHGSGSGCYNLASMYSGGHGVIADFVRANELRKQARTNWQLECEAKPRWCTNLAYSLRDGDDSAAAKQQALVLNERACKHGILVGCTEAVRTRRELELITPAAYVAELAELCKQTESAACITAGAALVVGDRGVTVDNAKGMAFVKRSCELGDRNGCEASAIELTSGKLVPQDPASASRYLDQACDRALANACFLLAEQRGQRRDLTAASTYARRGCQMGHGESCGILSSLYFSGRGVTKSEPDGERWAIESCRMGFGPGCGVLIERGRELPVPREMYERVYESNCERGIEKSCKLLEQLKR